MLYFVTHTKIGDGFKVEVKEPPQGAPPPAVVKKTQPPRVSEYDPVGKKNLYTC